MTIFFKSQTLAGPSSRHAISMPWPGYLMESGASAYISIWLRTSCAAMVCTGMKIKSRTICPWPYSLPCILSKMPLLQRKLLQQSENICLRRSAKRARTNFLPGLCARALSPSYQCTVRSLFFRHVLGLVSGRSTGTSLDLYIDKRNVAKTFSPTSNALHQ